ncbi:MAG: hypothetical protein IPK37_04715 [Austwickia sp.]|nr:MAG: hypothetical protein IPK37_04715 [Austwickia sp.]
MTKATGVSMGDRTPYAAVVVRRTRRQKPAGVDRPSHGRVAGKDADLLTGGQQ